MDKLEELRNEIELAMRAAKESMQDSDKRPTINIYQSDVKIYTTPPLYPSADR